MIINDHESDCPFVLSLDRHEPDGECDCIKYSDRVVDIFDLMAHNPAVRSAAE